MTPEEFKEIINDEIKSLRQKKETTDKKVIWYREVEGEESSEYKKALFESAKLDILIKNISGFDNLAEYARILAMTDTEIEDFKDKCAKKLDPDIEKLQAQKEQLLEEYAQLEEEEQQLIDIFSGLSRSEKERVASRGRTIINRRAQISRKCNNIDKKIKALNTKQRELREYPNEEVKRERLKQVKGHCDLDWIINKANKGSNPSTKLLASAATNLDSAIKMASLLKKYAELQQPPKPGVVILDLVSGIPDLLRKQLMKGSILKYSLYTSNDKLDVLIRRIEKYEESLRKAKSYLNDQYTEQKLGPLADYYNCREVGPDIDMSFLQLHADKLAENDLDNLKGLIEKKAHLLKYQTSEMKAINEAIEKEQKRIYTKIMDWYKKEREGYYAYVQEIIGYCGRIYFFSREGLNGDLLAIRRRLNSVESAVASLKLQLQVQQTNRNRQLEEYENRKAKVVKQIRSYGGEEHSKTPIPTFSNSFEWNFKMILKALKEVHQNEIVTRVIQEAQRQADLREEELVTAKNEELLEISKEDQASDEEENKGSDVAVVMQKKINN